MIGQRQLTVAVNGGQRGSTVVNHRWTAGQPPINGGELPVNRQVGSGDYDVALWVNLGANVHVCKDRCWFKTYESLNDGSILHMGNESTALVHERGCVDLRFSSRKIVSLLNVSHVPNIRKNLVSSSERGIECIFLGYAEHSKAFGFSVTEPNESVLINSIIESMDAIFDENRFSLVPRPKTINDEMDSIIGNNTWVLADLPPGCKPLGCKWIFKRKLKVDGTIEKFKAILVIQGFRQKSGIDYFDTYAPMDVKTTFLNGVLDEEGLKHAPKQWHQKFDEVVLFSGYLLNQADRCVYRKFDESGKGVIICLYIDDMLIFSADQVLKKFNYFDCTPVSTPIDTSEKLMPNNSQTVSQLEYSRVIGCLMYAMTCTRPDIAFAVGKASKKQTCITSLTIESEFMALAAAGEETEWLRNLILEIPLWSKHIAPISILYDSAATLVKAYSQMYNGKSKHLVLKVSLFCWLSSTVAFTSLKIQEYRSCLCWVVVRFQWQAFICDVFLELFSTLVEASLLFMEND
ncbi:zinc finger, CCHC-type containing protein [Tanacetum coccineum]